MQYNGETWVTLDGEVDLSQGKSIEDFNVNDVCQMFISGNLTLEELKKWISSKSAYGAKMVSSSQSGNNQNVSFEFEYKTFNLSTTVEAAKSQVDNIVSTDSTYSTISESDGQADVLRHQMNVARDVFILQYFGYETPNKLGILVLTNEEIEYVNQHPELFHYSKIEIISDNPNDRALRTFDDDYFTDYYNAQVSKIKTTHTQTYDSNGNLVSDIQEHGEIDDIPNIKSPYKYGKGEYDMFGNGNPPGPDGSIPTGVDGVYIKQKTI